MFTFISISSSTKLGALLSTLTICKSSPLSFKCTPRSLRYFMELNELFASVRGIISAYGMIYVYIQQNYEISTLKSENIRLDHKLKFNIASLLNIQY